MNITSFTEAARQIVFLKDEILRLRKQGSQLPYNFFKLEYTSAGAFFSTVAADVAGCSITLDKAGTYLITASAEIQITGTDRGVALFCNIGLMVNGTLQSGVATVISPGTVNINNAGGTVFQQWRIDVPANAKIKLRAWKTAGAANQSQYGTNTSISALWVGE
jgi:hypothetical protein